MGDDEIRMPAETMRERVGESRAKIWVLVEANRWVVTVGLLGLLFALLVALEAIGPSNLSKLVETDAIGAAFTSIIIAVVTSVTLVLTVAQLVLSQEIGSLGEKREQLGDEIEFRQTVGDAGGVDVTAAEPAAFLQQLVDLAADRAADLKREVRNSSSDADLSPVEEYAERIIDHSESVRGDLKGAEFGTFEVIMPVLDYNYGWKIQAGRLLREEPAGSVDPAIDERIDELLEAFRFFAPAREYFKALYFQWEIINAARQILFGSIPALAIAGFVIFAFDVGSLSGTTLGLNNRYLFVSALFTATFTPFAVLLAYILRILTVIKRTLSLGPFILREADRAGRSDSDD